MTQPQLLAGLYRWLDGSAQPATEHRPVPRAHPVKPEAAPEPCVHEQVVGLRKTAHIPDVPPANLKKPDADIPTRTAVANPVATGKTVRSTDAAPRPSHPKLRDLAEPVTDAEQHLIDWHVRRFTGKGIPKQEAQALAERLLRRDRQDDDRRSCAECASFRAGVCIQGRQPFGGGGIEVLHRCKWFKLDEVPNE